MIFNPDRLVLGRKKVMINRLINELVRLMGWLEKHLVVCKDDSIFKLNNLMDCLQVNLDSKIKEEKSACRYSKGYVICCKVLLRTTVVSATDLYTKIMGLRHRCVHREEYAAENIRCRQQTLQLIIFISSAK